MADEQENTTPEEDVDTTDIDEDTEDSGAETEPDTEDTPVDEWKPPTREEWEKLRKAQKDAADKLAKVNKESTQRRLKIRELEKANEDESAKAQREALEAAQARYKPVVAKSALLEVNARTDRVGALIKLLNMDSLEFDGNDEVVGLDLEVSRLQEEYPEFFVQPKPDEPEPAPAPKPAPRAQAAPKKVVKEPETFSEVIANRILGKN